MKTIQKDILTVDKGVIVQQVNMLGVMGAGLALQIAKKWPIVLTRYIGLLNRGFVSLGDVQLIHVSEHLFVANIFAQYGVGGTTKENSTDLNALKKGFSYLSVFSVADNPDRTIYIPHGIGCGLGGGSWNKVLPLLETYLPHAVICEYPSHSGHP